MSFADSIIALSSGRLPAGVAVVRLSGPHVRFVLETIAGAVPEPRQAVYRALRRRDGEVLDKGLVLFFPGPHSFTGEDVAELQVHGGRAVVSAVLDELTSIPGVRAAEPGEFTKRAFLNGKLDLTETEALADLVNAETEAQRRFAVLNASGAQADLYAGWRQRLVEARAMIEADIDFSDEEDVPASVAEMVWTDVEAIRCEIEAHIEGYRSAEIIRDGFDVVILGAPNSGKSSLFNALVKREAAIVTGEAGTTRDLLEVALDLGGIRVRITDTAGIREEAGTVEAIGISRALARAETADLLLILEDMQTPVSFDPGQSVVPRLSIGTKVDLIADADRSSSYDLVISVEDDTGIQALLGEIGRRAELAIGTMGEVLPSRLRHVDLLRETVSHLAEAVAAGNLPLELRSEMLRLATRSLGRIAGDVETEHLLDVIFSQFCIGK
ncbi:tRNA uridine-5-carboxymethylaminomethyl(34) synthesis GTPase MnmE [Aquamicrobium soli]|uniref:tRNA modification GTPase MnmE n=1 Tax=Aquamicrobium soli TaxID=1811518 RepID=A0ABV7K8M8_9HYPH